MANYNSKNILLVGLKGESGATVSHSQIQGRDAENQHPMEAITGLVDAFELLVERIAEKEKSANKVTTISSSSTDTQYPSAKCVFDIVGDIESALGALL